MLDSKMEGGSMPDGPKKPRPRGSRRRSLSLDEPPIFVELCDFCECIRPSSVKFKTVYLRTSFRKTRHWVCELCLNQIHNPPKDPPPVPSALAKSEEEEPS